jgi:hypothetical protein
MFAFRPAAVVLVLFMNIAAACPSSRADVYDATADFVSNLGGTPVNPFSVWTYASTTTLGGAVAAHTFQGAYAPNQRYWSKYAGGNNPAIWMNQSGSTQGGIPDGWLAMHPGDGGERSVLRFTTPSSGSYEVNLTYGAGNIGAVDLHLLLNSNSATPLFASLGTGIGGAWTNPALNLIAGDTIDLIVGDYDGYASDNTDVSLVLTSAIPEPTACGSLGLLAVALIGWRKQRKG